MGWKEKADRAKKLHRPSLKNWARDGLFATFPEYASSLLSPSAHPYSSFRIDPQSGEAMEFSMSMEAARENALIPSVGTRMAGQTRTRGVEFPAVLDACVTPPKEFHEEYEAKSIPCVIRNIPNGGAAVRDSTGETEASQEGGGLYQEEKKECDTPQKQSNDYPNSHHHQHTNQQKKHNNHQPWPAIQRWTLSALASDPDLRDRPLKCGEDDDGYTIRIKLKYFLRYLAENRDDSPLYIFDATFDEDKYAKRLLEDYRVPEYFDEDLFRLVGERRRPPYRWFLVGPARSGTTVHIDPLGTSAWNTLIQGVKRWVLFPPHVPKSVVKGRKLTLPGEDDEAIHYFCTILPRMKRRAAACQGHGDYANFECYEFTQYAGETVYIPYGWWHAVLNVTDTVGITQNFCSSRNFDVVWMQTRSGRKKMACSWLRRLKEQYPQLAKRAKELNRRDGFVMWEDDEEEQKKWRKKRAEKERKRREKERAKQVKKEKEKQDSHTASSASYGSSSRESKRSRVGNAREVSPE